MKIFQYNYVKILNQILDIKGRLIQHTLNIKEIINFSIINFSMIHLIDVEKIIELNFP